MQPADLVLGQPDLTIGTSNTGSGVSAHSLSFPGASVIAGDKLLVLDQGNHRVLIWNTFPTQNNQNADVVVGQALFSTAAHPTPPSATSLNNPFGLTVANGKMVVSDCGNNRVLIYNAIPAASGAAADVVVGQALMTSTDAGLGATALSGPRLAQIAAGKLIVPDYAHARVLIWNAVPAADGAAADVVLGQPDFTPATLNNGGVSLKSMNEPPAVEYDGAQLFVTDGGYSGQNYRVLVWNGNPDANFTPAARVIGQPDGRRSAPTPVASRGPPSAACYLYATERYKIVSDSGNHLVVIFPKGGY